MNCFRCEQEILDNTLVYTAFDRPYINLPMHKSCLKEVEKQPGGMNGYIQDNRVRFLELAEKNKVEFSMPTRKVKRKC